MPAQDAEIMDETRAPTAANELESEDLQIQTAGFLIQLSLDWIVLRASENVDDFLGESHVTLIEEPFSRFVQAQALHDLRNLFSRLSGSTGIARAYRVRLTDDRPRFDISFQVSDGRVLLEATPSPDGGTGKTIGSVGGLIESLGGRGGAALLEGAARRMRALTGHDRCSIVFGDRSAHSSRAASAMATDSTPDLPAIVADASGAGVPIFPRRPNDRSIARALLRSPSADSLKLLRDRQLGSAMTLPLSFEGRPTGHIWCESRLPRKPDFELHAATELFVQMLALRLEIDRLRGS